MADAVVPFIDLQSQRRRLAGAIDRALARVLDHGHYIMGPEVGELERALQVYSGVRHAVVCASGTDALLLALLAHGVGPGDAVLVPSFTFVATAEAVALIGATPVFVDVDRDYFLIRVDDLAGAAEAAERSGLRPKGIIPVDLFGQPADYVAINAFAKAHDLFVIADAAQSFGARSDGQRVGSLAPITTTSFFPAKPLGCYGDGGAVLTDDGELAAVMDSLRVHGKGTDKYDNVRIGINGRLDTIQAAILLEKLKIFDEEIGRREAVAARYSSELEGIVEVPRIRSRVSSVWAQYTIKVRNRDSVATLLRRNGVPSAVYYPKAVHQQTAYSRFPAGSAGLRNSEALTGIVLSLPMHPYLTQETQSRIIDAVRRAVAQG
jgi:dTDP-4-amino-4,6-dideoxygalactose transaminase